MAPSGSVGKILKKGPILLDFASNSGSMIAGIMAGTYA
jgi:hypothetical protein